MHAKLGIGLGTQPGYCKTWITGVTWHSSPELAACTVLIFVKRGSMHMLAMNNVTAVHTRICFQTLNYSINTKKPQEK